MTIRRGFIFYYAALYAVSCSVDIVSGHNVWIIWSGNVVQWPHIVANRTDELFPHRIVGGFQASIRQNCWQVALFENGDFTCGGVILTRFWVLTAAHCIDRKSSYAVRAGSRFFRHGGQVRNVGISIVNGGYRTGPNKNDVAMLHLSRALQLNGKVCKAKVATIKTHLPKHFVVTGWGVMRYGATKVPSNLRAAYVDLVLKDTCRQYYKGQENVPDAALCAAAPGKDSCQGDSGGPLTHDGVLFGIVSNGIGCANKNYPGMYMDIRYQHKWINNVMKKYSHLN